jgi:hypothetical protein
MEFLETKVNGAAESVIRKIPRVNNYRNFWDKDLNKLLKARQDVNKVQRINNKSYCHDSDLGKRISGLYRKRKEKLQTAIKQKEFQNKMKLLGNSGCKSRNKSKAFWNLLKGPKVQKKC